MKIIIKHFSSMKIKKKKISKQANYPSYVPQKNPGIGEFTNTEPQIDGGRCTIKEKRWLLPFSVLSVPLQT